MTNTKLLVDVPKIFAGYTDIVAGFTLKNAEAMHDPRGMYFGSNDKERRNKSVELLRQYLPSPVAMVWNAEIHGTQIRKVDWLSRSFSPADGMITQSKNLILTAKSADCFVILVVDPVTASIGIVHSGFLGTSLGAPKALIAAMQHEYKSNPKDLKVYISAGAGREYFVFEKEIEVYPKGYYLRLPAYSYLHTKKPMAAWRWQELSSGRAKFVFIPLIRQYIIDQLLEVGVLSSNIEYSAVETITNPNYNSFRRDGNHIQYPIKHGLSTGFIGMLS